VQAQRRAGVVYPTIRKRRAVAFSALEVAGEVDRIALAAGQGRPVLAVQEHHPPVPGEAAVSDRPSPLEGGVVLIVAAHGHHEKFALAHVVRGSGLDGELCFPGGGGDRAFARPFGR